MHGPVVILIVILATVMTVTYAYPFDSQFIGSLVKGRDAWQPRAPEASNLKADVRTRPQRSDDRMMLIEPWNDLGHYSYMHNLFYQPAVYKRSSTKRR
ncbi:hypothetical protein AAVH_33032 [Aphelenchoides avenae]|nr:hypothetical protein AAVH_33032 [Aphelenchus avenae]